MSRSSIPGGGVGLRIGSAWRWRCVRCHGWGSCRTGVGGTAGGGGEVGRPVGCRPGRVAVLRTAGEDPDRALRLVAKYLGWRLPATMEFKELDEFLLARALEHDSPTLLFRLACEYLISARVIRPGDCARSSRRVRSAASTWAR